MPAPPYSCGTQTPRRPSAAMPPSTRSRSKWCALIVVANARRDLAPRPLADRLLEQPLFVSEIEGNHKREIITCRFRVQGSGFGVRGSRFRARRSCHQDPRATRGAEARRRWRRWRRSPGDSSCRTGRRSRLPRHPRTTQWPAPGPRHRPRRERPGSARDRRHRTRSPIDVGHQVAEIDRRAPRRPRCPRRSPAPPAGRPAPHVGNRRAQHRRGRYRPPATRQQARTDPALRMFGSLRAARNGGRSAPRPDRAVSPRKPPDRTPLSGATNR